ncbi:hypothetical protein COMA2_120139 [Candidatus Nitrospira nitrificans]|uniref:Uncharacterized protein n=1 Tax=Candidatus Nitrospira nitrificans TaxID=1742973 RepID=A0A0S4L9E8_9BACT|nr:hypothetical protein COMA2_120139 [Candidatus Nitrospira nitrificans]
MLDQQSLAYQTAWSSFHFALAALGTNYTKKQEEDSSQGSSKPASHKSFLQFHPLA